MLFPLDEWAYLIHRWYSIGTGGGILFAVGISCAMVAVMPTYPSYFGRAASYSLVPYILHDKIQLMLLAVGAYGTPEHIMGKMKAGNQVGIFVIALAVGNLLFVPALASRLRYIIMPPTAWMFDSDGSSAKKRKDRPSKVVQK